MRVAGWGLRDLRFRVQVLVTTQKPGFRVEGLGFKGEGFEVGGLRCRYWLPHAPHRSQGLELRV